jgi:hypothetical protein
MTNYSVRACRHCGKMFQKTWPAQVFCGAECQKHDDRIPVLKQKSCRHCRKQFLPTGTSEKYCSLPCALWSRIDIRGPNDCWNWTAALSVGYGEFGFNNKRLPAHKVSYLLSVGNINDGLHVCHQCDNRACCNPAHLFLGTHQDNMRDAFNKNRTAHGSRNGMSKITEDQVLQIRELVSQGATARSIAARFGISENYASDVAAGARWKRVKGPIRKYGRAKKITPEKVLAIREDSRTHLAIAKDYGISISTVGDIKTGKTWSHV